jgi:hypothetical protein
MKPKAFWEATGRSAWLIGHPEVCPHSANVLLASRALEESYLIREEPVGLTTYTMIDREP